MSSSLRDFVASLAICLLFLALTQFILVPALVPTLDHRVPRVEPIDRVLLGPDDAEGPEPTVVDEDL